MCMEMIHVMQSRAFIQPVAYQLALLRKLVGVQNKFLLKEGVYRPGHDINR